MEPSGFRLPPEQKYERQEIKAGVTLVKPPVRTGYNYFDGSDLFPSNRVTTVTPKQVTPPPPRPDDK